LAKHVLNTSQDDLDFALIGIACAENQYVMLSRVNDALKTNLQLSDYIPYNLGLEYFLIPNTSNFEEPNINTPHADDLFKGLDVDESVKLVKELPKTDYFLILKGEDIHHYQFKVMDKLKTITEIIQLQTIEPADLPSRRNLIF
jgi:hypothetical protein